MEKFESRVKPGGLIVYESTNIIQASERTDIDVCAIPASDAANKLNNIKVANMVMLGAYLAKRPIVKLDSIIEALKKVLPERYHNTLPLNREALEKGKELMESLSVKA
jgi:2-oxoglutarate ferredoxin oxidoreductase subunit gamma